MATLAKTQTSKRDLSGRVAALQAEIDELEKQLGEGEDAELIVGRHIKLLHEYNEAKDACQVVLGKLASLKQTTVRQLHADYGLSADD